MGGGNAWYESLGDEERPREESVLHCEAKLSFQLKAHEANSRSEVIIVAKTGEAWERIWL